MAIKKSKDLLFIVKDPEVMKSPSSETYIIFGEAKIEDLTHQAASQAAKQFSQAIPQASRNATAPISAGPGFDESSSSEAQGSEAASSSAGGGADEEGLNPKDIELVMSQANVEREKAVEALRKNDGDIVNTIMELSME